MNWKQSLSVPVFTLLIICGCAPDQGPTAPPAEPDPTMRLSAQRLIHPETAGHGELSFEIRNDSEIPVQILVPEIGPGTVWQLAEPDWKPIWLCDYPECYQILIVQQWYAVPPGHSFTKTYWDQRAEGFTPGTYRVSATVFREPGAGSERLTIYSDAFTIE